MLTAAEDTATRPAHIRLVKMAKASALTVSYAQRKFRSHRALLWESVCWSLVLSAVQKDLDQSRRKHAAPRRLAGLEADKERATEQMSANKRLSVRNRFLFCAVRYHLIDPSGHLWLEDETYLEALRKRKEFGRADSGFSPTTQKV